MHEQHPEPDGAARSLAIEHAVNQRVPASGGPHVWIGTIAGYEAAVPYGRWIELDQPTCELEQAIEQVVARAKVDESGDGRWGVFGQIGLDRYPPAVITTLPELVSRARLVRAEMRAFHAWCDLVPEDRTWAEQFDNHFLGRYDQFTDWLTLQIEVSGWDSLIDRVLPAQLRPHVEINLDSLGHELLTSGQVYTVPDPPSRGVFVFQGHPP